MPTKLDEAAIQTIQHALAGLSGSQLKAEALRLAVHFNVSLSQVYSVSKAVRAGRKPRADRGKRQTNLLEDEGLRFAAECVVSSHLSPELALETAALNGYAVSCSLQTFQRYLREHGISRNRNKRNVVAARRFEASGPAEIYQFDISGVKERWFDLKTRKILKVGVLDVSRNHPNTKPERVQLWKFTLVDDYSRRRFVRFYAILKPTSIEVIDFLLAAFREMGIPKMLYTDNDAVIVGKRMQRAAQMLNSMYAASGGFRLEQHAPGNPKATGKAERSHQIVEEFEKLIGLKYSTPSLDALNDFALWLTDRMNWRKNKSTHEIPMQRWRRDPNAIRIPPPETLDLVFKSLEFPKKVSTFVTISQDGQEWQLPRKRPFVDWVGQTVTVIWPPADSAVFWLVGLDGNEYEIQRRAAQPDPAGAFKSPAESQAVQTRKALHATAKDRKAAHKEAGTELLVPGFDSVAAPRPVVLPKAVVSVSDVPLAVTVTPVEPPPAILPMPTANWLTRWEAVELLQRDGIFAVPPADADSFWVRDFFADRERVAETELRAALATRNQTKLLRRA